MTVGLFAIVKYENHVFWSRNRETFGDNLIAQAEKIIPNLKNHIEIKITATPLTCERYTLNHEGAAFGLASTVNQISSSILPPKTSINGLFLTGHWTTIGSGQGGIPKVAFCGRKVAGLILDELGIKSNFEKYIL